MARTAKAKRATSKKVLTKKLKEQDRNAKKVAKRREKIKKKLWELELAEFHESGLLSQLTWEYEPRVSLFGCSAIGFRSKEISTDNKVVDRIQKWTWKHRDQALGDVRLYRRSIYGYTILLALQMDWVDDDACYNEGTDPMVVTVFAIDVEETGTGRDAEKAGLKAFAENWNIEADIK